MGWTDGRVISHRAGHELCGVQPLYGQEPGAGWSAMAAKAATSPAQAAQEAEIVLSCVGTDDDLEADVTIGRDGAIPDAARRQPASSTTPRFRHRSRGRSIIEAESRGLHFVDAPVSGGQAGAEAARCRSCAAAPRQPSRRPASSCSLYAARIVHCGPVGAGQTTKMVNQIAIAGVLQGLSEALRFAQGSNLDLQRASMRPSPAARRRAGRWTTAGRPWPRANSTSASPSTGCARISGLALEEGRTIGASLPLTALVDQFYAEVQGLGGARQDTSALVRRVPVPWKGS